MMQPTRATEWPPISKERPLRVLALCLGNICRSPVAEALLRRELAAAGVPAVVDSAGTGAHWHAGQAPDPRSVLVAMQHGLALTGEARQLLPQDFAQFDLIVAMDKHNKRDALALAHKMAHEHGSDSDVNAQVVLMRDYDEQAPSADVPDPYYGGQSGFADMYQMLERSAKAFAAQAGQHYERGHS